MMEKSIDINEQIKSVRREIKMREAAYPRWVAQDRLTQDKADHELAAMRAVEKTLMRVIEQDEFSLS